MRLSHFLTLVAAAQAAPIIRTIVHTAAPVTQVVTKTTNTVVDVNTVIQTVNGTPPAPTTEATTEAAPTTQANAATPTTPTTEAAPTTPTTEAAPAPETPTTSTPTTEAAPTTSTPAEVPTTPATSAPATTATTPATSTTPTTTSTPAAPTTSTSPAPTTPVTTSAPTSTTPTTSTTPASTSTSGGDQPSSGFESDILQAHNDKRALHGVQLLTWDSELAKYAANYAANSFSCNNVQLIHSNGPYGENLAAGYTGGYSPVNAWYDEISQYDYNNPGFSEATGHFTQLVWKDTSKVGCAKVTCNNEWRQYTICEYTDSRGNVIGTDSKTGKSYFEENVLRPISS